MVEKGGIYCKSSNIFVRDCSFLRYSSYNILFICFFKHILQVCKFLVCILKDFENGLLANINFLKDIISINDTWSFEGPLMLKKPMLSSYIEIFLQKRHFLHFLLTSAIFQSKTFKKMTWIPSISFEEVTCKFSDL